jgi:UDP-glucose 4-epimerase
VIRTIVVTGACGGLGRVTIRHLQAEGESDVLGIDKRNWVLDLPPGLRFQRLDLRRGAAEDLLRTERPWGVVHLAFVSNQGIPKPQRHEVNVVATQRLLEGCARYGVARVVVLSRATVYGARPENPSLISEDMPLKLAADYAELSDLVEFDHLCRSWMWEHRELAMTLLRPVHVVGPNIREGMLHRYLERQPVPRPLGFDPMIQLVHEDDVARAIVLALRGEARGIYNVVGPGQLPLSVLLREARRRSVTLPHPLLKGALRAAFAAGLSAFPPEAVDFLLYACLADGTRIQHDLGYAPARSLRDTVAAITSHSAPIVA